MESPSGKLPYTVAKNESDYNAAGPSLPEGDYTKFPQSDFSEGVFIDYRDFDQKNITPRYEFGFGLSYTTFAYSDFKSQVVGDTGRYSKGQVIEGGISGLWDVVAKVSAVVTNTGGVDAAEVAQLYVVVGGVRQLRGFSKVQVPVGHSVTVEFDLLRRDLSSWDVEEQTWVLEDGDFIAFVGSSSRDLPLQGSLGSSMS